MCDCNEVIVLPLTVQRIAEKVKSAPLYEILLSLEGLCRGLRLLEQMFAE